jgi:hypothetical protein
VYALKGLNVWAVQGTKLLHSQGTKHGAPALLLAPVPASYGDSMETPALKLWGQG